MPFDFQGPGFIHLLISTNSISVTDDEVVGYFGKSNESLLVFSRYSENKEQFRLLFFNHATCN